MKASIFEERKPKTADKRIAVLVPESLFSDIEDIKTSLKEKAPDKRFNTNAICVDALKRAVNKAKKELAAE
jgi:hypothetical protein